MYILNRQGLKMPPCLTPLAIEKQCEKKLFHLIVIIWFLYQSHAVYQCPRLTGMAIDERRFKVKSLDLCYNCLGHGHRVFDCKSSKRCSDCKGKHHTLLHTTKKSSGEPEVEMASSLTSTLAGAMAKVGAAGSCGAAISGGQVTF